MEIRAFFEILLVTTKNPQIPAIFGPKSDIFLIDRGMYPDFSVNIINGVLGMLKSNIELNLLYSNNINLIFWFFEVFSIVFRL